MAEIQEESNLDALPILEPFILGEVGFIPKTGFHI